MNGLRISKLAIVAVLVGSTAWLIANFSIRVGSVRAPTAHAATSSIPYYVHLTNYSHRPDGTVLLTSFHTYARRGDGSIFEKVETVTPEGNLVNSTRHFALQGGIVIDTEDVAGLMTAMRLPNGEERRNAMQWDPAAQCSKKVGGGGMSASTKTTEEEFMGYAVFRLETDLPRIHATAWRARDLGCVELKNHFEIKDSKGSAEATADTIQAAEPPAALFEIPVTFKNVAPSVRAKGNPLNVNHEVPESFLKEDELFAKYKASLN